MLERVNADSWSRDVPGSGTVARQERGKIERSLRTLSDHAPFILKTRADFATTEIPSDLTEVFVLRHTAGFPAGLAVYEPGSSSGPLAIQDKTGAWFNLVVPGEVDGEYVGLKGDGSFDNASRWADALNALGSKGGTINVKGGVFLSSATIDVTGRHSVIIKGRGGLSGGTAPATMLLYSGTGTGKAVDFSAASGCWLDDLALEASQLGFTGSYLRATSGGLNGVRRCLLVPNVVDGQVATLINLDGAVLFTIDGCNLGGGKPAVQLGTTTGLTTTIGIINRTHFISAAAGRAYIEGCCETLAVNSAIFEPGVDGFVRCYRDSASAKSNGVTFKDIWAGDQNTDDTNIMFHCHGPNHNFIGGTMSADQTSSTGIQFEDGSAGIVQGTQFKFLANGIVKNGATGVPFVASCGRAASVTTWTGGTGTIALTSPDSNYTF